VIGVFLACEAAAVIAGIILIVEAGYRTRMLWVVIVTAALVVTYLLGVFYLSGVAGHLLGAW